MLDHPNHIDLLKGLAKLLAEEVRPELSDRMLSFRVLIASHMAQTLAIECAARIDQGCTVCARQALEAVQVPIGGGPTRLPLARLVPSGQLMDLEEILEPFCG